MMNQKLQRIDSNNKGELPNAPKIIITARNVKNPAEVVKNTKEIMKAISQFAYTTTWPSDEEWKDILPKWFVESMTLKTLETIMKTKGQWHYESWIDNIRQRFWLWWSSKTDNNTIQFVLEAVSVPYLHDSFIYIYITQPGRSY